MSDIAVPSCANCPDNNSAMARCDNCSVYLCQPCLEAHARNRVTRQHKTTTFEEIQSMRSTRPSSTVPQNKSHDTFMLTEKLEVIEQRMVTLSAAEENIDCSKNFSISEINGRFDELLEELQQRRATLLSQVETKADTARKAITRARESHKTSEQKLQKATTSQQSSASVDVLLKESPEDVEYDRLGVSFIPANIPQLTDTITVAGQVRTVDFRPTDRPDGVPETEMYNAIQIQPDDFPLVPGVDKTIAEGEGEIFCPHLEWDPNTASDDVTVSETEISNIRPVPPPPDTGCRIRAMRKVMATRPVVIRRGQRVMYHVKVRYSVKRVMPENRHICDSTLTSCPIDASYNSTTGLHIRVKTCQDHEQQLCLRVACNGECLADIPLTRNQVGAAGHLQLCVLLDSNTKTVHVVEAGAGRVIISITDVVFDKPLWVMMSVGDPDYIDMTGELISGNKVTVTQEMTQLLSSLY